MEKRLLEKLKKAQEVLSEREIGLKKIELVSYETRRAFDAAIERLTPKINFRAEISRRKESLKRWKVGIIETIFPIKLTFILSAPFIYGMIFPAFVFDICLEIYHHVCFRIYGIPIVRRKNYFTYDRALLPYLNILEKINCFYCSYFNNLIAYASEIAGRTERFWCPIKYSKRIKHNHSQYNKFVDYLDAESFRTKWDDLREFSEIKKGK